MQTNNYQSNYNPSFRARFINNVKNIDVDTIRVRNLFEKLTKDSTNEILTLAKLEAF